MENIKIPSPSAIIDPPASRPSAARAAQTPSFPGIRKPAAKHSRANSSDTNRPKQSKSRNGCITCKTKRLKCDESKPTCLQCKKRNVQCGGYKKDFKWRPFEESNMAAKATTKVKKDSIGPSSPPSTPSVDVQSENANRSPPSTTWGPTAAASTRHVATTKPCSANKVATSVSGSSRVSGSRKRPQMSRVDQSSITESPPDVLNIGMTVHPNLSTSPQGIEPPELSPWLSELLLPTEDIEIDPELEPLEYNPLPVSPRSDGLSFSALLEGDSEDVEEIVRQCDPNYDPWFPHLSGKQSSPFANPFAAVSLPTEPELSIASPEMLIMRFDRVTCGILSVKDGVTENPWRTLIWPLAKDTPALYHAIFSMAAFHSSRDTPALRVHGVDHMRQSITCMVQGIQNMRTDAALATSLALAFAETWDSHTRTCIHHLRGAKALVSQALQFGIQNGLRGGDLERVRFLYNTWLYMDVIARLTSLGECGTQEIDLSIFQIPGDAVHDIDPLMGCATTLFPLIYHVAKLIQRARKSESNSIALVSQAIELKAQIEQWEPPSCFEPPEDPTSEIQHSIQTAHAYRWATLLYLHQAVPEMPSEPAADLAKRVLILLATVPLSSRTTIIHIFPLLAAGCEAEDEEDRNWVLERWTAIQSRLKLGSVDHCLQVVREIWARRDAFQAEIQRRQLRGPGRAGSYGHFDNSIKTRLPSGQENPVSPFYTMNEPWRRRFSAEERTASIGSSRRSSVVSPLGGNIEFEKTVRGKLHWVNLMKEWRWEGKERTTAAQLCGP